MPPMIQISKPRRLPSGRYAISAWLTLGDDRVHLCASAAPSTLKKLAGLYRANVSFGALTSGDSEDELGGVKNMLWRVMVGAEPALRLAAQRDPRMAAQFAKMRKRYPDGLPMSTGGVFDQVVSVVSDVAHSPIITAIPFVGTAASAIGAATDVYAVAKDVGGAVGKAGRAGERKVNQARAKVAKIKEDAAKGIPAARQAKAQLQTVAQADKLLLAAKAGSPKAARAVKRIARDAKQGNRKAIEAALVLDKLARKRAPALPLHVDLDKYARPAPAPAYAPQYAEYAQYAQPTPAWDPYQNAWITPDYGQPAPTWDPYQNAWVGAPQEPSPEQMTQEIAADVVGAIMAKRPKLRLHPKVAAYANFMRKRFAFRRGGVKVAPSAKIRKLAGLFRRKAK